MAVKYEIRQQVRTVHKAWMEVIASGEWERTIRNDYDRFVKEFPNDYFELVLLNYSESCLEFTSSGCRQKES